MEKSLNKIMIVDDNITNLATGRSLLKNHYKVYPVPSAEKMFETLEVITPDLILLDIEMPVTNGYQALKQLKDNPLYTNIPVIFLTAKDDEKSELKGFELGAVDYMTKPFSPPLLLKRIENQLLILEQNKTIQNHVDNLTHLVDEKTKELSKLQNSIISSISEMIEIRDGFTGGHVTRTQCYMDILIKELFKQGVYEDIIKSWDLKYLLPSVQLHDVGKIGISDAILNKPGPLTDDEFEVIKNHVSIGLKIVKDINAGSIEVDEFTSDNVSSSTNNTHSFLYHAGNIIMGHHEKWNGDGYVMGLSGEDIPLEGRLMAIADVYDALISKRSYKEPLSHEKAVEIICEGAGSHFDPKLVDVFLKVEKKFQEVSKEYA
jgi:putative two-component system response regulator